VTLIFLRDKFWTGISKSRVIAFVWRKNINKYGTACLLHDNESQDYEIS
jgi:hypothetical protein